MLSPLISSNLEQQSVPCMVSTVSLLSHDKHAVPDRPCDSMVAVILLLAESMALLLAGVGQQLDLLERVVACIQRSLSACQLAAGWTQHAQQLQHSMATLKAVVGADATSAGR